MVPVLCIRMFDIDSASLTAENDVSVGSIKLLLPSSGFDSSASSTAAGKVCVGGMELLLLLLLGIGVEEVETCG